MFSSIEAMGFLQESRTACDYLEVGWFILD